MAAMPETSLTSFFTQLPDISITLASGQVTRAASEGLPANGLRRLVCQFDNGLPVQAFHAVPSVYRE
jgi:hypothetical protein